MTGHVWSFLCGLAVFHESPDFDLSDLALGWELGSPNTIPRPRHQKKETRSVFLKLGGGPGTKVWHEAAFCVSNVLPSKKAAVRTLRWLSFAFMVAISASRSEMGLWVALACLLLVDLALHHGVVCADWQFSTRSFLCGLAVFHESPDFDLSDLALGWELSSPNTIPRPRHQKKETRSVFLKLGGGPGTKVWHEAAFCFNLQWHLQPRQLTSVLLNNDNIWRESNWRQMGILVVFHLLSDFPILSQKKCSFVSLLSLQHAVVKIWQ